MSEPARIEVFLDAVQAFVSATFGPDEMPAEVRINLRTDAPGVMVVTDHGGRITVDTLRNPSDN